MSRLVLSRKQGERIVIDEKMVIEIRKICGSQVKVAIDAPPEIQIRRGELPPRDQIKVRIVDVA